jgi:hypothetical protein
MAAGKRNGFQPPFVRVPPGPDLAVESGFRARPGYFLRVRRCRADEDAVYLVATAGATAERRRAEAGGRARTGS